MQWTLQDDLALLQHLAAKEVEDEEKVEWGEMCEEWDSARFPYYLVCATQMYLTTASRHSKIIHQCPYVWIVLSS